MTDSNTTNDTRGEPTGADPDGTVDVAHPDAEHVFPDGPLTVELDLTASAYVQFTAALEDRADSLEDSHEEILADALRTLAEQARLQVMEQKDDL